LLVYKDYYIMHLLMHTSQALTVDDLSELLSISRRSVYYALMKINEYLTAHQQQEIKPTEEGIKIDDETRRYLKDELHDIITETYIHTPKERKGVIALLLLSLDDRYSISDFERLFKVSRNTVITDINALKKQIKTFNLSLKYAQDVNYYIEGRPLRQRSFLLYTLSTFHYLIKINAFDTYDQKDYDDILVKLHTVEQTINVHYVKETKEILAKMIAIIKKSNFEPINFDKEATQMIEATPEYQAVVQAFNEDIFKTELLYITLHLLGLRVHAYEGLLMKDDKTIHEMVSTIINKFKSFTLMQFDDEKMLYDGLYYHMKSAIIRYKYGIIYENELKNDIKERYPSIYNIAKKIVKELEAIIQYPISDDDVAYIAMHFGGHLKREKKKINTKTILLVCLNGISTSKLLRRRLEETLEGITIIDAVSLEEIEIYADDVDFIVSTIPIENNPYHHKTIMVQTLPTEMDLTRLKQTLSITQKESNINDFKKAFLKAIKKQFNEEEYFSIKTIFTEQMTLFYKKDKERIDDAMLNELLTAEHIMFKQKANSIKEALFDSAKPLIDKEMIETKYVDKVLQNLKEMGPYIVVAPYIAISHARPTDGVNELSMSLLKLEESINFSTSEDREVKVVITLAAPDENSHLTALGQLSNMLMSDSEALLNASKKEDIIALIEKYSEKEDE